MDTDSKTLNSAETSLNSESSSSTDKQKNQQPRRIFKIIVIGDSNVGKTCLTFRFCGGKFLARSEATIGVDFREKTVQIEDESIKLQIWDTGLYFNF
jgi:GTPase SAR1 family protein